MMMVSLLPPLLLLLLACSALAAPGDDALGYVPPLPKVMSAEWRSARTARLSALPAVLQKVGMFVGTGGVGYSGGQLSPMAQVPFGTARPGPDTAMGKLAIPFYRSGGFYQGSSTVLALSHTHLVGAGTRDYGTLGMMPLPAEKLNNDTLQCDFTILALANDRMRVCNYLSAYSQAQQVAHPGYYSVYLEDHDVLAEMTATPHVAVHRHTFNYQNGGSGAGGVVFDISHTLAENVPTLLNSSVDLTWSAGPRKLPQISGWIHQQGDYSGRFGGYIVYFVAEVSAPLDQARSGTWTQQQLNPGATHVEIQGGKLNTPGGFYLAFDSSVSQVEIRVALSFVSVETAAANLEEEAFDLLVGHDYKTKKTDDVMVFDAVVERAVALWEESLNLVTVQGGSQVDNRKLYTSLYHAMTSPSNFTESGGQYIGFDHKVHNVTTTSDGERLDFFTDLSMWDTWRAKNPLIALVRPDVARSVVWSIMQQGIQSGGKVPRWSLASGEAGGMTGEHSAAIYTDALQRGLLSGFDTSELLSMIADTLRNDEKGNGYAKYGYTPGTASQTLEYAFDDFCLSQAAEQLQQPTLAKSFLATSANYHNVWDTKRSFFVPRFANGTFDDATNATWPLKAVEVWVGHFPDGYTEGDAWQWRWFVPHNVTDLISLFGSADEFNRQLNHFIQMAQVWPDMLPNPWYWAGNEPSLTAPHMFNYAGRQDLSIQWVDWIMDNKYNLNANGLNGNDDYGTLSSWWVWNAFGLYPQVCTKQYAIVRPRFDSIHIHRFGMSSDRDWTINMQSPAIADPSSPQTVSVNGQTMKTPFIPYSLTDAGSAVKIQFTVHSQ